MNRTSTTRPLAFIVLFMLPALPVSGHHGAGTFDLGKTVSFTGARLTRIEFINPHSWIYFEVADANGRVSKHRCEMRSAHVLRRSGWIDESDLPPEVTGPSPIRPSVALPPSGVDYEALVSAFEEDLIVRALDATGWNKNRAAQLLNLKRTTLVEKIRSKGIAAPEERSG